MIEDNNGVNDPIEELLDMIRNLPQDRVYITNITRFTETVKSIKTIVELITKYDYGATYEVAFDPLIGTSLECRIVFSEVEIPNASDFANAIKVATNFTIFQRTDGKSEMDISYQSVRSVNELK